VLQAKECTPTFYPFDFYTFGLAIESIKEFGGVSNAFFLIQNPSLNPLGLIGDPMPSFLSQTLIYTVGIDQRSHAFFLVPNLSLHHWY
jgi:hypothetical protein